MESTGDRPVLRHHPHGAIDKAPEMYETFRDKEDGCIKVVLKPCEPRTPEAAVVQDADRLDALGAVGIARTFLVAGSLGSALAHPTDPFPTRRPPDDRRFAVDHFYAKLLTLAGTMRTDAGRAEAERRTAFLRTFLHHLADEFGTDAGV
jgi:HD superfamily phosphodiesterase